MRRNINIFKAEFALFICVFYLHYVKRNIMELPLLLVVLFCFALVFLVGSNFTSDHRQRPDKTANFFLLIHKLTSLANSHQQCFIRLNFYLDANKTSKLHLSCYSGTPEIV